MNEEFVNIEYSPIWNFQYSSFIRDTQYNGKTLSDDERKEFVATIDKTVAMKSEDLPMMFEILKDSVGKTDIFNEVYRTVVSMMQFVLITSIDSMVMAKYFLLADKDYDRRLMRGKMLVILNEGFKRLYGFDEKSYKKSVWNQLLGYMKYFPEIINRQYQDLTSHRRLQLQEIRNQNEEIMSFFKSCQGVFLSPKVFWWWAGISYATSLYSLWCILQMVLQWLKY